MTNPKKIVFAPGVLEQMEKEFTPEEMQQALDEIAKLAADPNLGKPVDLTELMRDDPNTYFELMSKLEAAEDAEKPTLQ